MSEPLDRLSELRALADRLDAFAGENEMMMAAASAIRALLQRLDEAEPLAADREVLVTQLGDCDEKLTAARSTIAKQRGVIGALLLHHDAICRICPEARRLDLGEELSVQNARAALDPSPR